MAFDKAADDICTPSQLISAQRRPIAVDLFCGIGGMGLGFEQAGFDVLAAVDHDPLLAAVHAYNHPQTRTVCADVSKLVGSARAQLGLLDREVDVVFGGPPCQGFSSIGKRQPDDPRNELVGAFAAVAAELQPRYIVMENVAGLAFKPMQAHLDQARVRLEDAGYEVAAPTLVDAASYGVPQRRKRVFLFAWQRGLPVPMLPSPTHGDADALLPAVTVKEALGDLAGLTKRRSSYVCSLDGPALADARRLAAPKGLTGCELTAHTPETVARFDAVPEGAEDSVSRYTRLRWNGLCHTMRAGTGPDRGAFMSARPIHPGEPRVITVREAARLHGYPDWFQFHRTKWHSFRGIGNSVPPPLARSMAGAIMVALDISPKKPDPIRLGPDQLLSYVPDEAAQAFKVARGAKRLRKKREVTTPARHR